MATRQRDTRARPAHGGGIATNLLRPQRTSHQALLTQQPETGRHRRAPEKRASYREVFAVREFRWLWVAQVLSFAGDQFAQVAIAILVFRRTDSAFLTALTYALTYLPPIAGGPLLSGLADLLPRRRVMIACDLARVVLVGLMAVRGVPFWVLCTLLFGTVLLSAPFSSARSALVADILSEKHCPSARPSGTSPTRQARSPDSSPAPPWSPPSAATGRWASTRLRSEYQLLFS
jgi:hypothetical protein